MRTLIVLLFMLVFGGSASALEFDPAAPIDDSVIYIQDWRWMVPQSGWHGDETAMPRREFHCGFASGANCILPEAATGRVWTQFG